MRGISVTIIDDPDDQPKVISVHGMVVRGNSVNADNIARLRRVIAAALARVQCEWERQADALLDDLRSRGKAELAALPDVTGKLPNVHSVGKNRGA